MTDNERMPVPLYHGTSMLFFPSIRTYGLGAKDPNVAFRSREMLYELASARAWNWYEDPHLMTIRSIVDQNVTSGGFNFRHGSTYLSPLKTTAVGYALNNRFGSELLSTTFCMFEKLKAHDLYRAHEIIEKYPELLELHEMPHQPLLVEAFDIPIRSLRSEDGGDPTHTLSMLRENANDPHELMWQQLNFELTAPHPPINVKYYCIECRDADPIFPKWSLKIVEPPPPAMDQQA